MSIRTLVVTGPGHAEIRESEEEPLLENMFRAETMFSGLSAGTELTWFRGTNPFLTSTWDAETGSFAPGRPSVRYPIVDSGYMSVARVSRTRTAAVEEGATVAMTYGHSSAHHANPLTEHVVVLPEGLDAVLGVFAAHLGPICANGLLHAAPDHVPAESLAAGVRDRLVLVTGAGPIGLLTGLLASAHGAAEVVVADPDPARRRAAEALGLNAVDEDDLLSERLKARWRHGPADHGADLVFQCRGRAQSLANALRALRPQGIVIDLAFYPGGAEEVRLGEEFHHNGLTLRCAQIGRVPRSQVGVWDRRRLSGATVGLLRSHGALIREHVITDVLPLADAPGLLAELSDRRRSVITAAFDLRS